MNKFFLYYSGISSIVFFVASAIFFSVYENIQGGLWAGAAALVAAKCFILHCLYFSQKLHMYYTSKQLNRLTVASIIIILITSAFLVWYMFTWVYWKIPIFEYKKTPLFPLVFCFITGKFSVHKYETSKKYSKYLSEDYSPVNQTV